MRTPRLLHSAITTARRLKSRIHWPDQRVTQTLASGIVIRQDFRTSTRFVFFDTGYDGWQYATHGGTLFVVIYRGRPYGLTCRHVFKDFDWGQLVVTDEQYGQRIAGMRYMAYPSEPTGEAIDTDMLDIAVIQFDDDVDAGVFKDTAYIVDEKTVTTSNVGDQLLVHGTLKTHSRITEKAIEPKFCFLDLVDDTPSSSDPTLRRCVGVFDRPEFEDVVGLSGSPVLNATQSALCGMVVRGMMNGNSCTLWYVDMFDVWRLLKAVHEGQQAATYNKVQTTVVKIATRGG